MKLFKRIHLKTNLTKKGLPFKSLSRFRCVSKLWSSIITSRDFRNRRLNITPPPRLLITFADFYGEKILVASTPNPNAPSYSSSSNKDLILVNTEGKVVYNAGQGLICVGAGFQDVGICNPSKRQVHNFPYFRFKDTPQVLPRPKYMLGYDHVEDKYKVLAVDDLPWRLEHKIMVLGGEETWREVPCVAYPHVVLTRGLYMKGSIYYGACMKDTDAPDDSIIVTFDVKLETFNIIKIPSKLVPMGYKNMWLPTPWVLTDKTLINYKGKIGVVENPREGSFRMWVVEDAEQEVWSMNTFALPEYAAGFDFKVMETFSTCEVCLVRKEFSDPFCLFYYDLEEESMRSVTIEGLPMSELKQAQKLSVSNSLSVSVYDHYENSMSFEN
ncbi:unnamed protein product [Eruca vesicaria subsp. sativa]|uniref:F-box associated domain-containing protein n=1 Tax=Eruca vesicaria subsp. sativa TaxID=29727 RepID=A0ABC8JC22_ERUVS|nr:unnamed protein product [Eruca vesicaria subsp. sativa]